MSFARHLQQASFYLNQSRFPEAEKAVRLALAEQPDDLQALSVLASCQAGQQRVDEALSTIEHAIGLAPDLAELGYQRAYYLYLAQREPEALGQIDAVIRLEPNAAEFFALRAELLLKMKRYEDALAAADHGLSLDPENSFCLNVRASSLIKLKRADEAFRTMATSLESEPENSYSHANLGWTKLEHGRHREAREHFVEALRLNPNNDYARGGMVEALKAKNPVFRLYLQYMFWMSRLSAKYQWAIVIGAYVLFRLLRGLAENNPALKPLLMPVLILYIGFALSTWLLDPLANLFLFFDPQGRFALSRDDRHSALLVGSALGAGLLLLLASWWWESGDLFLIGLAAIALMIPLGSMYNARDPKSRRLLRGFTFTLLACWALALLLTLGGQTDFASLFIVATLGGVFIYQWVANVKTGPRY
ncbi:MAG: tetratricopeptide repeat protein [Lewinella sp.]|nr:tetratricopeptide repeat protein [Lewinella sp.]